MVQLTSIIAWLALVAVFYIPEAESQANNVRRSNRRPTTRPTTLPSRTRKTERRRDIAPESSAIIFVDEDLSTTTENLPRRPLQENNEIPLSFLSELSNFSNINDVLHRFGLSEPKVLHTRLSGIDVPITATTSRARNPGTIVAESATCEPQKVAVAFEKSSDPSVIYFPFCTRIERCGGCCPHELFECSPKDTDKVTFLVHQLRYTGPGEGSLQYEGEITMDLEKHISCACECRTKETDCNKHQTYLPNECRCECKNHDEASKCIGMNKYWSAELCRCLCVQIPVCSSGSKFIPESCSCEAEKVRELRTYGSLDSTEGSSTLWMNKPAVRKPTSSRSRLFNFDD